jgi:hypothetical protein
MVACTRSKTQESASNSVAHPTSIQQVNSDTAKENILRLFFQEGSTPELPSSRYIRAEEAFEYRLLVKLGVCLKLSASHPNSLQRIDALRHALDSLHERLRDVLKGENAATKDQEDVISRTEQRLYGILASPGFATRTSDELFAEFLDVFVSNDSLTQKKVLDSLSIRSYSLTREAVGTHLNLCFAVGCYDEERTDSDWSRDAGSLLSECFNLDYEDRFTYWIGKAPRTSVNARAKQPWESELTEDRDSAVAEGTHGEEADQ